MSFNGDKISGSRGQQSTYDWGGMLETLDDEAFKLSIESREMDGLDLELVRDPKTLLYSLRGTIAERHAREFYEGYSVNPIVKTVRALLFEPHRDGVLDMSATALSLEVSRFEGVEIAPTMVGRIITKFAKPFQSQDGIRVNLPEGTRNKVYHFRILPDGWDTVKGGK